MWKSLHMHKSGIIVWTFVSSTSDIDLIPGIVQMCSLTVKAASEARPASLNTTLIWWRLRKSNTNKKNKQPKQRMNKNSEICVAISSYHCTQNFLQSLSLIEVEGDVTVRKAWCTWPACERPSYWPPDSPSWHYLSQTGSRNWWTKLCMCVCVEGVNIEQDKACMHT